MGQVTCCSGQINEKQANIYLSTIKTEEPAQYQASPKLRQSLVINTLISRRGFTQGDDGEFLTEDPLITETVYNRLANLAPLNIPGHAVGSRGQQSKSFFKVKKTGIIYSGQWKNGVPNGIGKNYYPNGGIYEGTFVEGVPHGYGRFIMPKGDFYTGQVKFGRANGFGVYQNDSSSYKGNFKDNLRHGKGQQKGSNFYFNGQYEYGEKKQGLLKYNGNVYDGGFLDGSFMGHGKLATSQGQYIGDFKSGDYHGYGQFKWIDGSTYRGYYSKGYREGLGQYFNFKDSSIAKGIWKKGVLNGQGQFVEPRGQKYKCIWVDGRISNIL